MGQRAGIKSFFKIDRIENLYKERTPLYDADKDKFIVNEVVLLIQQKRFI